MATLFKAGPRYISSTIKPTMPVLRQLSTLRPEGSRLRLRQSLEQAHISFFNIRAINLPLSKDASSGFGKESHFFTSLKEHSAAQQINGDLRVPPPPKGLSLTPGCCKAPKTKPVDAQYRPSFIAEKTRRNEVQLPNVARTSSHRKDFSMEAQFFESIKRQIVAGATCNKLKIPLTLSTSRALSASSQLSMTGNHMQWRTATTAAKPQISRNPNGEFMDSSNWEIWARVIMLLFYYCCLHVGSKSITSGGDQGGPGKDEATRSGRDRLTVAVKESKPNFVTRGGEINAANRYSRYSRDIMMYGYEYLMGR